MRKSKVFMLLSTLLLLFTTFAITASAAPAGGWTVAKARYSFLTSGQKKLFKKAVEKKTGVKYKPVSLLSKQKVAGTNYVFLCQGTTSTKKPAASWYILAASKSLENKVALKSVKKISINSIKTAKKAGSGSVDGGFWTVGVKNKPKALSNSVRKVFRKGTGNYKKYVLRPIALLGTQAVKGKKYRFLCYGKGTAKGTGSTAGSAVKDVFVVDVHKNVNGKCSVSSCKPLNLEKNVKAGDGTDIVVGTEMTEVQKLAAQRLDLIGWDLYAAYRWAASIKYNINIHTGDSVEGCAKYGFINECGNASAMAAVFCEMASMMGYQAWVICGLVPYRRGGYGEHTWVEINVEGNRYVCDPSFEVQEGKNGFMINYGQSGTWHYVYGYIMPEK